MATDTKRKLILNAFFLHLQTIRKDNGYFNDIEINSIHRGPADYDTIEPTFPALIMFRADETNGEDDVPIDNVESEIVFSLQCATRAQDSRRTHDTLEDLMADVKRCIYAFRNLSPVPLVTVEIPAIVNDVGEFAHFNAVLFEAQVILVYRYDKVTL